ncbi:hypothetical protein ONS96_000551 [Cadophora gregata f. sp. sojae]|nr:hypothetical protein ONS96_000551 [Cadophora gregata f. sp. sojae]
MSGGFSEYAAHPAFGFVKERKLDSWGRTDKLQPFAGVRDVAKYLVASTLTIPSPGTILASDSQERQFKIPTSAYTWDEIVTLISRLEGTEKYAKERDVGQELAWDLKAFLGDPNAVQVPKPWDTNKFPEIEPEELEVSLKRFLDATK